MRSPSVGSLKTTRGEKGKRSDVLVVGSSFRQFLTVRVSQVKLVARIERFFPEQQISAYPP
jgi:hypothetical protein